LVITSLKTRPTILTQMWIGLLKINYFILFYFSKFGQFYRKNQNLIVKGCRTSMWFRMNKVVRIGIDLRTLLVWILNSCWSLWCDLG
jgi:hypothetical protein